MLMHKEALSHFERGDSQTKIVINFFFFYHSKDSKNKVECVNVFTMSILQLTFSAD